MRTEITALIVCNTTANAATFSVYHDNDGTTFSEETALAFSQELFPNTSTIVLAAGAPGVGVTIAAGGSLGIKSGTASAMTFTLYGVTESRRST
jgi:hypothetical protein